MAPSNPLLALPGMAAARDRIEARLRRVAETGDPVMTEMASHLIVAGGKRLRPVMAVAAAGTGGGDLATDDVVTGGVAVELVHLGSLYHDDVIDEATTRRTVESVNARWGNLRAILAGDFLLAKASELASSLGTDVARLLARTIARLCEGEVHELSRAYDLDRSEADYLAAIEGKTAVLFSAACRIGALAGGLPPAHVELLAGFGHAYGMAFQIVDDVLDVVATDEELGKPAGHDMAEGVYTLPVLRTLASPDGERLRALLSTAMNGEREALVDALALVRAGTGVSEATAVAAEHVERATALLEKLPASAVADAMAGAASHLLTGLPGGDVVPSR